jgi:Tol biopolymer transport system component
VLGALRISHTKRTTTATALTVTAAVLLPIATGDATTIEIRTEMVSRGADGGRSNGASANPSITPDGRVLAFETTATNVAPGDGNGGVSDIVSVDLRTGERRLVTENANAASTNPAIAADGKRVAFVSSASNLVAGDTNRAADVFVRDGRGLFQRVSVGRGHAPANGPSSDPDISPDGRYVVFTSSASNLVPGDRNRRPDVFLRDLKAQTTRRLSVSTTGKEANAASVAPANSANGRVVSFASRASNLVRGDTNRVGDVFVRLIKARRTERVSVSTDGTQQNRAVIEPFSQVSDLSRDGRYVVFDSDAHNLVARDANRRTDVFRHDRKTDRTTLISASSTGYQGNNDSFAPRLTPDGHFVAFESFAGNLARGGGPREDIFVRDLVNGTTAVVNVPASGGQRSRELVRQLLQRPAISDDGRIAAFISTAPNLTPGDTNGVADVFIRKLAPPRGRVVRRPRPGPRPVVRVTADDPRATTFVCRVDRGDVFPCPRGDIRVRAGLAPGPHVLRIRAGGPGMLFDPVPLVVRFTVTRG